ncbi:ribonuclease T2 family protein [Falsigemmobacter faecalis]|uniref:Ribonuclease T n=1 Tax=Falsigemmobacter faecalis TaxID=2488730 RepID=A0A3P3DGP1_9RHOB|nr:ribonuclease T2 [Falsigemmobacter faecalis]RRH73437.1 ribonuclease T [Falsigemmobacter faecalis]
MRLSALLAALLLSAPAAQADVAGEFDYYVMALSWTPNWCALEGDKRGEARCARGGGHGWSLHGLWPQHERGWPDYCRTRERDPSRAMTASMDDIMGSAGLAWHQWKKHGRCSGLSARAYYDLSRKAYTSVQMPEVFEKLDRAVQLPARVVEEAFLEANPGFRPEMVTVTCRRDDIQEVRICLTKDLSPRTCGRDVSRDCSLSKANLAPPR